MTLEDFLATGFEEAYMSRKKAYIIEPDCDGCFYEKRLAENEYASLYVPNDGGDCTLRYTHFFKDDGVHKSYLITKLKLTR